MAMAPKKTMATTTDTTYTLSMDVPSSKGNKNRRHRRGSSTSNNKQRQQHYTTEEEDDGSASLTYSAGSSIASSAAGESTDSSFADIMKVLDVQDSEELKAFMKREGVTDPSKYRQAKASNTNMSVASSLNYSTDGESALEGAHLLQTITGQPSDSFGPDGGGFQDLGDNILFAPADEPVKRKGSKRNKTSPKTTVKKRSFSSQKDESERQEPSTPPPVPRNQRRTTEEEEDDEVWYAKWWMCGFADSFRDLVPKR